MRWEDGIVLEVVGTHCPITAVAMEAFYASISNVLAGVEIFASGFPSTVLVLRGVRQELVWEETDWVNFSRFSSDQGCFFGLVWG